MWFTENPWPPMLLLGAGAVVCLLLWFQNRRGLYAALAGAAVLGCGAVYWIERVIVTESEVVEDDLRGLVSAFQHKQIDKTLSYFSEQAPDLKALVGTSMNLVDVRDDLHVRDVEITLSSANSRALSHFRANATISVKALGGSEQPAASRWLLTWQKEAGAWKIIKVERLDPITGEEIGVLEGHK